MTDQFMVIYLDDILIYSPDLMTHVGHVRKVLLRLHEMTLFARADKCDFQGKW
jgi:hypothetical protein